MNKLLLILLSSFVLFSCNEEKTKTQEVSKVEETAPTCIYGVNMEDVKFEWTAFKTTEKVGVKGTFDKIEIINEKKEKNIADLLLNTKFSIDLSSLNSANKERDVKIINSFFGNLSNSDQFTGTIQEAKGNNEAGGVIVLLKINGLENIVKMDYKIKDDFLKLAGDLDLLNWKTEVSFEALNKACFDLHKGEDGVSKTWTDIHIEVSTMLHKDCK